MFQMSNGMDFPLQILSLRARRQEVERGGRKKKIESKSSGNISAAVDEFRTRNRSGAEEHVIGLKVKNSGGGSGSERVAFSGALFLKATAEDAAVSKRCHRSRDLARVNCANNACFRNRTWQGIKTKRIEPSLDLSTTCPF